MDVIELACHMQCPSNALGSYETTHLEYTAAHYKLAHPLIWKSIQNQRLDSVVVLHQQILFICELCYITSENLLMQTSLPWCQCSNIHVSCVPFLRNTLSRIHISILLEMRSLHQT
jgi:hypothetical protein